MQNRYVSPAQAISQMVVDVMYDATCLPAPTAIQVVTWGKSRAPQHEPQSQPAPTPMMMGDTQVAIPPLEGEFTSSNLELMQTNPAMTAFDNMMMLGDVFTYSVPNQPLVSVNKTQNGIIQVTHPFEQNGLITRGDPSWGIVGENHYRLAFTCGTTSSSTGSICYWDTSIPERDNYYLVPYSGYGEISPNGSKIVLVYPQFNGVRVTQATHSTG